VVGAALVALHAIVLLHIRRSLGPIGVAAAIVGMDVALGSFILARPHVLVWPIAAGWTALLLRSLETGRPPPLWSALLLVLWTNMHGSFPLAILIAGAIAVAALAPAETTAWPQGAALLARGTLAV